MVVKQFDRPKSNIWSLPDVEFELNPATSDMQPDRQGYPLLPNGFLEFRFVQADKILNLVHHYSAWAHDVAKQV